MCQLEELSTHVLRPAAGVVVGIIGGRGGYAVQKDTYCVSWERVRCTRVSAGMTWMKATRYVENANHWLLCNQMIRAYCDRRRVPTSLSRAWCLADGPYNVTQMRMEMCHPCCSMRGGWLIRRPSTGLHRHKTWLSQWGNVTRCKTMSKKL